MQRVDQMMDGLLVSGVLLAPFYLLYKIGICILY